MAKKRLILVVSLIIFLGLFVGCEDKANYYTDRVLVDVDLETRDQFFAGELSIEKFEWKNVKKIESGYFEQDADFIRLTVYLKKKGVKHVKEAIDHFKTLEFVLDAMTDLKRPQTIQ